MNKPSRLPELLFRGVFILYTLALLTATHWPGLAIHGPFSRTDLIIHAGVFGVWTCLLYCTGYIASGSRSGGGCGCFKRRIIWTMVVGVGFGFFDELTQPMFRRVADPLDMAADTLGVLIGGAVITLWVQRFARHPSR